MKYVEVAMMFNFFNIEIRKIRMFIKLIVNFVDSLGSLMHEKYLQLDFLFKIFLGRICMNGTRKEYMTRKNFM